MAKKQTGIYEWAAKGMNCTTGCKNSCQYCLGRGTRILLANGRTKPIEEVQIGDKLLAFKKGTSDSKGEYVESKVLNQWSSQQPALEIYVEDGRRVITSANHRWLTNRGWKFTTGCMVGSGQRPYLTTSPNSGIYSIGQLDNEVPSEPSLDYMEGYLCGIINGDGTVGEYFYEGPLRNNHIRAFRLAMKDTEALDRAELYLRYLGIVPHRFSFNPGNGKLALPAIQTNDTKNFERITELLKVRREPEFLRGFIAGIFDAEGTGGSDTPVLRIFNSDEAILSTTQAALTMFGFKTVRDDKAGGTNSNVSDIRVRGGTTEAIRFYNTFGPSISRKLKVIGTCYWNGTARIKSVCNLGKEVEMFDLTTSSGTFIAEGLFSHNCYARKMAVLRKEISTFSEWAERPRSKRNQKEEQKKYNGVIMVPTTHDIFPENFGDCKDLILNLLHAGNELLITSKPRLSCMPQLYDCLDDYKDKITFRFTIGCRNNQILKVWEPGAPSFEERLACLVMAFALGYKTSVSMEPMLDAENAPSDAMYLHPYCTGDIWIGKMNKIAERVGGVSRDEIKRIEHGQRDESIRLIYNELKNVPRIQWKDSIKEVIGLSLQEPTPTHGRG